jgi:restriction system protein
MVAMNANAWGMHSGTHTGAEELFRSQNLVAIGYEATCPADLRSMPGMWDAFKAAVAANDPTVKAASVPVIAGQPYRFLHEVATGDLVVYRAKGSQHVHVGRIDGDYYFAAEETSLRHRRPVQWLRTVPISNITQGALFELGAFLTLFKISKHADEFSALATAGDGAPDTLEPQTMIVADASVTEVASDIDQSTRDYVLKILATAFKGHPLAHLVAQVLRTMGFRTRVSPPGADQGVDVLAHPDELGFQPPRIKVQVKSGAGAVGSPDVQALLGTLTPGEFGLFVALGGFSSQARAVAKAKDHLRLVDGDELVDLILARYEQFDPSYKAQLPLRRVYVPDVGDTEH